MNGDTRIVRGAGDAGCSERNDEENETRNVGRTGQRSYRRERETGKVKPNLRDNYTLYSHHAPPFHARTVANAVATWRGPLPWHCSSNRGGEGRLGGQPQFESYN